MANPKGLRSTRFTKAAGLVQLFALGGIEVSMFIGALKVKTLWDVYGFSSPMVLTLAGIAALTGILSFDRERALAKWGLLLFVLSPVGIFGVTLASSRMSDGREALSLVSLALLATLIAGYFFLLFGSLKTAGWALGGSVIIAIASAAFWMLLLVIGATESVSDDEMANRMVTGLFLLSSALVAFVAFLIEIRRKRNS